MTLQRGAPISVGQACELCATKGTVPFQVSEGHAYWLVFFDLHGELGFGLFRIFSVGDAAMFHVQRPGLADFQCVFPICSEGYRLIQFVVLDKLH